MGTRSLICVVQNGEYKVAQYAQWDGNPSGQGHEAVEFILSSTNMDRLRNALSKVRFLEPEGRDKEFLEQYNNNLKEPSNYSWFMNFITRDLGSKVLTSIINSTDEEILLKNTIDFAKDSLFCEWAYVVNLDNDTLEIYQGFNEQPVDPSERFYEENFVPDDGYYQVKLVKIYKFSELDLNSMSRLEDALSFEEEDDIAF